MSGLGELGSLGKSLIAIGLLGFAAIVLAFVPSPLHAFDFLEATPAVEIKAPPPLKLAAMPKSASFDAVTARPLFNRERKPDPLPPPPEPPKPEIVLGDISQFRVEGLVTSGTKQIALVRKEGAQLIRLKTGDTLEGWKIEKIDAKGISISGGDRIETLKIRKADNRAAPPSQ